MSGPDDPAVQTVQFVVDGQLTEPALWRNDAQLQRMLLVPVRRLAAKGAAKVLAAGERGALAVTLDETMAMAVLLERLGLFAPSDETAVKAASTHV